MPQTPDTTELLVLDPRMSGWPLLLAAADSVVLVLDVSRDGLAQILEVAIELAPLSAIHIAEPLDATGLRLGFRLSQTAMGEQAAMLEALGENLMLNGVMTLRHAPCGLAEAEPLAAALAAALKRDVTLLAAPELPAFPDPKHRTWPRSAKPPAILQSPWLAPRANASCNPLEPRSAPIRQSLSA